MGATANKNAYPGTNPATGMSPGITYREYLVAQIVGGMAAFHGSLNAVQIGNAIINAEEVCKQLDAKKG